ncbi:formyltransferase family protein [Dechloromonas sp. ZY10]|uniref:formyltransferase family protein n=1 Tax=Dechloromonas aquae TaxID=2664436 RepID=UPI0035274B73
MKFAITLSDRYLGVLDALLARGWEAVKIFSAPVDQRLHDNRATIAKATQQGLPLQLSRLNERDLAQLGDDGCELLVVASYRWRIGDWQPYLPAAINFHPSPLPLGRGPDPLVAAILRGETEWGVSCHRLDPEFDAGPLLKTRRFQLAFDECRDSLDLKVQMQMAQLAGEIADDFPGAWAAAKPQADGEYFPLWTEAERELDFNRPLAELQCQLRAFGSIECSATINGQQIQVRRAVGWHEWHEHRPGALVHVDALRMVVAVPDGYLGIVEWSLLHADAITGNLRR